MLQLIISFACAFIFILPSNALVLDQAISKETLEKANSLPKKTSVDITADEIRYNDNLNYYEAKGNVETYMPDKDATLYADRLTYNGQTKLIEAFGKVKVVQQGTEVTGTYVSFSLENNQYFVEAPKVFANGIRLKARKSTSTIKIEKDKKGNNPKNTISFEDGVLGLDKPFRVFTPAQRTFTRYSRTKINQIRREELDWNDLPERPLFKYSAKEIIYDDTKDVNNLEIVGARFHVTENLSIPSPVHITTTVGDYSGSRIVGPVFGQRNRLGGFTLGPRFYKSTDHGLFSLAPVLQIGDDAEFGGGAILGFSRPGGNTTIIGGYGSLEDRFIANVQQRLPGNVVFNYYENQFMRNPSFGATQVGRLAELRHIFRFKVPYIVDRNSSVRIDNSFGFAKDNGDLFSDRRLEDLAEARGDKGNKIDEDNSDFRSQHDISFYTNPFFRMGNEFYNLSLSARARSSLRFYGSGDVFFIGQIGPSIQSRLKNIEFEIAYLIADTLGESPFLFDQFVQGDQSILFDGDYKINEWVSIGALLVYNLDRERFVNNEIRTEFGPKDFKLRASYDPIRNQADFGINMILGDPVNFDNLDLKVQ